MEANGSLLLLEDKEKNLLISTDLLLYVVFVSKTFMQCSTLGEHAMTCKMNLSLRSYCEEKQVLSTFLQIMVITMSAHNIRVKLVLKHQVVLVLHIHSMLGPPESIPLADSTS